MSRQRDNAGVHGSQKGNISRGSVLEQVEGEIARKMEEKGTRLICKKTEGILMLGKIEGMGIGSKFRWQERSSASSLRT